MTRRSYPGSMSERKAPQIPQDMMAFNQNLIADFRATQGRMTGQMEGRGILLLTTKGARSGEPRTAVLGYGRHGDRYVVIASNNGASKAPAWYHNLLAHPKATVEVGPDKFEVRATTAKPEEREELAKRVPYLEGQQKLTTRQLPLVVLEKV
jgi:deazaflavin-dependent oxidoreductase (nitroreductase family)